MPGLGEEAFHLWLVVWNINFIFPYIGNNHFQRGWNHQPDLVFRSLGNLGIGRTEETPWPQVLGEAGEHQMKNTSKGHRAHRITWGPRWIRGFGITNVPHCAPQKCWFWCAWRDESSSPTVVWVTPTISRIVAWDIHHTENRTRFSPVRWVSCNFVVCKKICHHNMTIIDLMTFYPYLSRYEHTHTYIYRVI
jgi:hypothetical protein